MAKIEDRTDYKKKCKMLLCGIGLAAAYQECGCPYQTYHKGKETEYCPCHCADQSGSYTNANMTTFPEMMKFCPWRLICEMVCISTDCTKC